MRAHILQHVAFEGPGSMAGWLAEHAGSVGYTHFHAGDALPDPAEVDLLIAMGGPMSVNDEHELPWLVAEKAFIRAVIARGTPVLGICLGAQLIASALGARVFPNGEREIGWFPVTAEPAPESCFGFPSEIEVFHWHGETFELPAGAVRLARSEACLNQAFQFGERVVGLQFHLETTPETAAEIMRHCADELVPARWVQPAADIEARLPAACTDINVLARALLDWLTRP